MSDFSQKLFFENLQHPDINITTLIRHILKHVGTYFFDLSYDSSNTYEYVKDVSSENWLLPFKIVEIDDDQIALEFVPIDIELDGDSVLIKTKEDTVLSDMMFTPERMIDKLIGYDRDTIVKFRVYDDNMQSYNDHTIIGTRMVFVENNEVYFASLKFETV